MGKRSFICRNALGGSSISVCPYYFFLFLAFCGIVLMLWFMGVLAVSKHFFHNGWCIRDCESSGIFISLSFYINVTLFRLISLFMLIFLHMFVWEFLMRIGKLCMNHIDGSVKFTHAGHVILQLIHKKLWSKMLLWAFQPHKLPILTPQLCLVWRATPRYGVTPLPYL